jgi:hypothetical protein
LIPEEFCLNPSVLPAATGLEGIIGGRVIEDLIEVEMGGV